MKHPNIFVEYYDQTHGNGGICDFILISACLLISMYLLIRVDTLLTIKIADFGLAKDVYSTEYYRVDKHTTLPVKWMSIESLLDGYFDEKTDVVCYGIINV